MIEVNVTLSGPLPEGTMPALIEQALRESVQKLVEMGEQRLDQMASPRPQGVFLSAAEAGRRVSTGRFRQGIHSIHVGPLEAMIGDGGIVYGPWLEGTSARNQTTRFKGYGMFRKTAQRLNEKADAVLAAELRSAGIV